MRRLQAFASRQVARARVLLFLYPAIFGVFALVLAFGSLLDPAGRLTWFAMWSGAAATLFGASFVIFQLMNGTRSLRSVLLDLPER